MAQRVRLSPHFHLDEFSGRDGALPSGPTVPALKRLCVEVLEPMRARFGRCTVTSGLRSRARNREVGGAPGSRHVYEDWPSTPAADVVFAKGTPEQWAAMAISMGVGGVGLYPSHLHVDQRRGRVRW